MVFLKCAHVSSVSLSLTQVNRRDWSARFPNPAEINTRLTVRFLSGMRARWSTPGPATMGVLFFLTLNSLKWDERSNVKNVTLMIRRPLYGNGFDQLGAAFWKQALPIYINSIRPRRVRPTILCRCSQHWCYIFVVYRSRNVAGSLRPRTRLVFCFPPIVVRNNVFCVFIFVFCSHQIAPGCTRPLKTSQHLVKLDAFFCKKSPISHTHFRGIGIWDTASFCLLFTMMFCWSFSHLLRARREVKRL